MVKEDEDWLNDIRMCGGFVKEFMMDPRAFRASCRANEVSDGHAGHNSPNGANGHGKDSISANGVPQMNVNADSDNSTQAKNDAVHFDHTELVHVMHMTGSSSQLESHAANVDHPEVESCMHKPGRVDELPSEIQDDTMEPNNNFVEGVRAPDVSIEELDVICQVHMEEKQEVQKMEEELIIDVFPWTSEEEEKLEEGVKEFEKTRENGKTMPWKQILELGANIFHPQRSADNLKVKWGRMCRERIGS